MIPPILPFMIIHQNQIRNFEMQQKNIRENKKREEKQKHVNNDDETFTNESKFFKL